MKPSILLVDDHPIFLKGLRSLIEDETDMEVIGEAGDGQAAIELLQTLSPSVVVMDITMPGINGIEATRQILSDFPNTKVIALSIHSEKKFVESMLQAGASGYIVKESVPEELVKGIRAVMNGQAYLSPSITGLVVSQFRQNLSGKQTSRKNHIEIIETKLHPPLVSGDHVHRQRLTQLLEKSRQLPLQTVIAPAGYGKSELVCYWLKDHPWPNAWISLDADDNDLHRFLTYIIYAVRMLFPQAMSEFFKFLNTTTLPPLQVLAGRLINELNLIDQDFILVLDNFHLIRGKKIHDLMVEVLRHPPKPLHLILISRSDPFLPLAKFRAQGQLEELRLQDLRFTETETQRFLEKNTELPLEKEMIAQLTLRTEGWITALRLANLSIRHRHDFNTILSELNGSPEYVMEYLFHEVFSSQPKQIQDCLLKTAILDRFCAPLCDALLGMGAVETRRDELDSQTFIQRLKQDNMFIFNLDTQNHWFRYHQLFQQLLQHHLRQRKTPAQIAALHAQAADWFAHEGLPDEAITHALAAGDAAAAAGIIEQNRHAVLDKDQWHTLEKWLDRLPHDMLQERPGLLLGQAWIWLTRAQVGELPPILQRVKSLVDPASAGPELLCEINFFQGLVCYFQCKPAQSAQFFNTAVKLLPKTAFIALRSEAEYWECLALHLNGQKEAALETLNQRIGRKNLQQGMLLSRLRFGLCFIHMLDGQWDQTFGEGLRMIAVTRSHHLAFAGAWAEYVLGNAGFQTFELKTAHHHFSQAVQHRYIKNHRAAIDAMAGLAMTQQFMGAPETAAETMTLAKAYAHWTKDPGTLEIVGSCQARISLLRGDLDSASRWQKMTGQIEGHQMMIFFLEIPLITECRVLIAVGSDASLAEAAEKLGALHQKAIEWQNTCQQVEIMVLQSLAQKGQDRVEQALTTLEAAVTLAAPGKWIRPFIEPGPPMEEMLRQLQTKEVALDFIEPLLAALEKSASGVPPVSLANPAPLPNALSSAMQTLTDPLTKRELEILALLAKHLYNREIAEKLYISPETVKTHLKKIYEKLAVDNRRNAVSKARELGLVPRQ